MKCQAITTIKVNGVPRTCHNDALRMTRFCWMSSHKAQGGSGIYTPQLPEVCESGAPMDMSTPLPTVSGIRNTIAHIKSKLNNEEKSK